MESIETLTTSLEFSNSHDEEEEEEVEPLISIQSRQAHLDDHEIGLEPMEQGSGAPGDLTEGAPTLGMEFESPEAARAFYSAYADRVGFRVRNSKSFTSRVDEAVIMRRFVCSKQGRPTRKDPFDLTKKRRNRVSSREGCKAMLQVNRRENRQWAVSRCVLDHCHSLGIIPKPSLASQKKLKKPWELVVPTCVTEPHQSGLGAGGGVAQSLLEYFKKLQTENPAFFYAIQLDRNNCVANVFWADAKARMAYSYFGDTVIFDMTCKKNKRVVPFATFTGVNHHRQVIVFGCAFMTDESEASFVWLFETWLVLMSGRRPISFTTAWNEGMSMAAVKVFPNVRHRFCKRDVFSKCKERLSDVYSSHSSFKAEFKKCVNESESVEEFESCWKLLLERYRLEDDMWLRLLYDMRASWVPAYFRSTFFAEMPGAQKLETMHKFFQRHSITTTTLRDLVTQFDKAMAGQYEKEMQADFTTIHTRAVLKTPSPVEKQASEIYTRTIFELFQEELVESSGFLMEKIGDGVLDKFRVAKVDESNKAYIVTYNAPENRISCSCCLFEFSGILCRHVFRVSLVLGIVTLPEDYILRRWSRNAKSNILSYEHCTVQSYQKALSWRCNDLCRDAIRFAEEGSTSAVIYKAAKEALQNAFNEIYAAKRGSFFDEAR
ncbi:protein FAR1-RELATED SEQUENCE 5-like [Iris pallida]|uniref:Protein FAR1-RELATED SEQUENCE n=1 Tax=Iris pallida TaxID=29817 RepID=A0AAX6GN22_IRIPA|nr:protein FAR1-RELATED SEQUENCE 5-like [Iris pallida]